MIVLDASVLIAHLDKEDAHHQRATALLRDVVPEPLGVSPITLAEVLVGPARSGQIDPVLSILRQLPVETIRLGDDATSRLAVLRAGTGLRLPDCCVLLAAEQSNGVILTFDDQLAAVAARRGMARAAT